MAFATSDGPRPLLAAHMATKNIIDWFEANNKHMLLVQGKFLSRDGMFASDLVADDTIVRMYILQQLSPLPHGPGSVMELHVRLLETACSVIDWDAVVRYIRSGM